MKLNKNVVGLAVAVVGLSLAAQAPAVFAKQKANDHSVVSVSSSSEATAVAAAKVRLPGTVKMTHLDRYHGKATWKIRILSADGLQRGDFRIDATTGLILNSKIKQLSSHQVDRAAKLAAKIEKEKLHLAEKAHKLELKGQKSKQ